MKSRTFYSTVFIMFLLLGGCEMSGTYLDGISDKISSDQNENSSNTEGVYDYGVILSITEAGPEYVTLTWTEPEDTDFSHVEIIWQPGPEEAEIVDRGSNTFNMPSPGEGAVIEINAQAVSVNGDRSAGNVISVRIPTYQRDVVCIYTVEQLAAIDDNPDSLQLFYILRNDLSLSSFSAGLGWQSIGTSNTNAFSGIFDGNGHKISDLYINRSGDFNQGFFGYVLNGFIENTVLENVNISGQDRTGGLAGAVTSGSTIRNCSVSGTVSGADGTGGMAGLFSESEIFDSSSIVDVTGTMNSGAFFGNAQAGSATACTASGTVNGSSNLGGFAGFSNGFDFTNSSATVNVSATGSIAGGFVGNMLGGTILEATSEGTIGGVDSIGGFAGYISSGTLSRASASTVVQSSNNIAGGFAGDVESDTDIVESRSTGSVTGINRVGGFIGRHNDTGAGAVIRSYANSTVNGTNTAGGFVGESVDSDYQDCSAKGDVFGSSDVGGFVGFANSDAVMARVYFTGYADSSGSPTGFIGNTVFTGTYTDCYYDSTTAQFSTAYAGILPLTTAEMKNSGNFSNWDFTTIWTLDTGINDGYPYLQALEP